MTTRDDRIAAGVAFMDERRGTSWVHEIELDELSMGSPHRCIVGQLEGVYYEVAPSLFDDTFDEGILPGSQFGFDLAPHEVKSDFPMTKYDKLTSAWKTTIRRLRKERAL